MSSYEKKAPRVRIDSNLHEYLKRVSEETGLSKVKVSKKLAESISKKELSVFKTRQGFKFDFKI